MYVYSINKNPASLNSVAEMERNVYQLEAGNYDVDDSEIKQKYDNQRQLNIQLQEQKRWLEHELEEVCCFSPPPPQILFNSNYPFSPTTLLTGDKAFNS
jgi:hypothetical protein